MMQKEIHYAAPVSSPIASNRGGHIPEREEPSISTGKPSLITVIPCIKYDLHVHWSDYASWHAIANHCMQVLAKEGNKVKEGSETSVDLSSDEFHWGKLSLLLINDVKTHLPSNFTPLLAFG
jgi:hypothetical protein